MISSLPASRYFTSNKLLVTCSLGLILLFNTACTSTEMAGTTDAWQETQVNEQTRVGTRIPSSEQQLNHELILKRLLDVMPTLSRYYPLGQTSFYLTTDTRNNQLDYLTPSHSFFSFNHQENPDPPVELKALRQALMQQGAQVCSQEGDCPSEVVPLELKLWTQTNTRAPTVMLMLSTPDLTMQRLYQYRSARPVSALSLCTTREPLYEASLAPDTRGYTGTASDYTSTTSARTGLTGTNTDTTGTHIAGTGTSVAPGPRHGVLPRMELPDLTVDDPLGTMQTDRLTMFKNNIARLNRMR